MRNATYPLVLLHGILESFPEKKKMRDSQKGLGCLVLFALPFAGVGLFMAYLTGSVLWEWSSMRSWREVPATIESTELETHQDSDSTSHKAVASYRYSFEGVEYRGTRVSLHLGSDNIGDFQERSHTELSRAMRSRSTISCFVNPAKPDEAILYREPRWGLLGFYLVFVVVFGGVGFGLLFAGLFGSRSMAREEELARLHPEEPWRRKESWHQGRIASTTKPKFARGAFFAVIWNAISAPLIFLVPQEFSRGNVGALIGLVFPLVGVGLVISAGRHLLQLWKFGESFLEMDTVPGVIGGRLTGRVRSSKRIHSAGRFEVRLSAVRSKRVGTGDNARTEESILWQKSHSLTAGPHLSREGAVPVSFVIPNDLPPTDDQNPNDQSIWRLLVIAEIPGVDYEAEFEVPVFRTAESGKILRDEEDAAPVRLAELGTRLERAGIRVETLPTGKRYLFAGRRQWGAMLLTTLVFAVCIGIAAVLFYSDAPRLFPWTMIAFDVLFLFGILDFWLHSSRIEVRPGELSFRGGLLGRGNETRWSAVEIAKLETRPGMQAGNRQYHQLQVVTRWDKRHVVAKRIPDLETAQGIASDIEEVLRS